jgi:hypothetical protein
LDISDDKSGISSIIAYLSCGICFLSQLPVLVSGEWNNGTFRQEITCIRQRTACFVLYIGLTDMAGNSQVYGLDQMYFVGMGRSILIIKNFKSNGKIASLCIPDTHEFNDIPTYASFINESMVITPNICEIDRYTKFALPW